MTKPTISKNSRYRQGIFIPTHPEKYVGESEIRYRSSWELRVCKWFDSHPAVLFWSSESMVVPYLSPLDNKMHRYYVDFVAKMKSRDGSVKTYAIEIKPESQCKPPRNTKNRTRMLTETSTYLVNQAKWKTAKELCARNGIEFIVLTEKDLGIT